MGLEFRDVGFSFGGADVLHDVSLTAAPGGITCLLGGSGTGKTTLLRLAAGMLRMQRGEIWLDGVAMATPSLSPPPEKRPVGLVFQDGALFPHMSAGDNVAYGLARGGASAKEEAHRLLEAVGLGGMEDRYPHTLSGGQQQRVALARALAPNPRVLLMDEPFASIDIVLRRRLRAVTRTVLADRDCVALLVTHDPEEALELADHIAVLEQGRLVQAGSPQTLYDSPGTLDVGRLIGGGTTLPARVAGSLVETAFGRWAAPHALPDGPATALLREHGSTVAVKAGADGPVIADVRFLGPVTRLTIEAATSDRLTLVVPRDHPARAGDRVDITPSDQCLHVFRDGSAAAR